MKSQFDLGGNGKPQFVNDFSAWLCPLVGKIRVKSIKQLIKYADRQIKSNK